MNNATVQSLIEAALAHGMIPVDRLHLYKGIAPVRHHLPELIDSIGEDAMLLGYVQINGQSVPAFKAARSCTNFIALWVCGMFGTTAKMYEHLTYAQSRRSAPELLSRFPFMCDIVRALRRLHHRRSRCMWISPHTIQLLGSHCIRLEAALIRRGVHSMPLQTVAHFLQDYRNSPMKVYANDHSHDPSRRTRVSERGAQERPRLCAQG